MDTTTLLLFIPACFALNLAPGPNNLLSLNNAARYGFAIACLAGSGRILAFVAMIGLAAAGLATVLHASEWLFLIIKTVGALYLIYLAVQLWRAPRVSLQPDSSRKDTKLWQLIRQEFFVAAGNPKAILIFTAFLPQFIDPATSAASQFLVLGLLFLIMEWAAIALYACMGLRLQDWLSSEIARNIFSRCCACLLGVAGAGLLLAKKTP